MKHKKIDGGIIFITLMISFTIFLLAWLVLEMKSSIELNKLFIEQEKTKQLELQQNISREEVWKKI